MVALRVPECWMGVAQKLQGSNKFGFYCLLGRDSDVSLRKVLILNLMLGAGIDIAELIRLSSLSVRFIGSTHKLSRLLDCDIGQGSDYGYGEDEQSASKVAVTSVKTQK